MRACILIVIAFVFAIGCSAQSTICSPETEACTQLSTQEFRNIFEHLSRKLTASEQIYELSDTPSPQFAVHVFRNGIELNPGTEFVMRGTTVLLTPKALVSASDVITAAYKSASPPSEGLRASRALSNQADRALVTYLNRSLQSELARYMPNMTSPEQEVQTTRPDTRPALVNPATHEEAASFESNQIEKVAAKRLPASLRMLSVALRQPAGRAVHAATKRDASQERGFEGLGDDLGSSPYDVFADTPGGLNAALNALDERSTEKYSEAGSNARGLNRNPESLRMLGRSLNRNDN